MLLVTVFQSVLSNDYSGIYTCANRAQRQRPELQPHYAEKRLQWAQMYAHFTPDDWRDVKWTDECSVERGKGVQPIWTWNTPTEQLQQRDIHEVRCGRSIKKMFRAGFGYNTRTGLVPLDGDPESLRGGVTSMVIRDLYKDISTWFCPTRWYIHA